MRKTFIYVLLFFFIFALNFSFFESTSYAFVSSLDSPAGAELAAYESGAVSSASAATDAAANVTATGSVSGAVVSNSGSFAGGNSIGILGASGLSMLGISAAGISSLQNLAKQKYCTANSTASVCGSYSVSGNGIASGCVSNGGFYSPSFSYQPTLITVQHPLFPSCYGTAIIQSDGTQYGGSGYVLLSSSVTISSNPALPWSQWDSASRNAAVQLLQPTDYYNNAISSTPTAIPSSMTNDPTLAISKAGFYLGADGNWYPVDAGGSCTNLTCACNSGSGGSGGGNNGGGGGNTTPPTPAPSGSTSPPTPSPTNTTSPPTPTPTNTTSPPTPTPTDSGTSSPSSCDIMHPATGSDSKSGFLVDAANLLISILPSTPDNMRIPTILANMGGQGSLGGNLALELYSTAWQYFAIIAFVKFYKLIPGKMT